MRSPRSLLACLAFACVGAAPVVAPGSGGGDVAVVAGTRITNTATASYGATGANVTQFSVASNTIVTIVGAVSAVIVGPSENACNAADSVDGSQPFTKTFTVSNISNVRDAYVVTVTLSTGTLLSIVATTADGTQRQLASGMELPPLDPGGTLRIGVTGTMKTLALGTSSTITLHVRSSVANAANGEASATATQCATAARPATFTGITLAGVPKLVDGVVSEAKTPGAAVTYSIALRNAGGITARAAVLSDPVPAGIVPLPETATVDGVRTAVTLSGNRLTIPLGDILPAGTATIAFGADVAADAALGTSLVNVATASAANVAALASDPASVVVGYDDIVYDGYVGQAMPVPGASLTFVNPTTHEPLVWSSLPSGASRARSHVKSSTNGSYTMDMPLDHKVQHFEIEITAPSYRSRRIDAVLTPDPSDTLYNVTLTALDGQLLARPGAFALESGPIRLNDVYGVFGNMPLFRTQALTISKTVDRQIASAGDRLEYSITYANVGLALGATTLVDQLPPGLVYAPHTSRLDGKLLEPVANGRALRWTFPSLLASHTLTLAAVVLPGVAANSTLTNLATVASEAANTVAGALSASATVATTIVDGIFSDRTVLTGRVYVDIADTGSFRRGDSGVPFVRLFLETGESVLTDGDGRFSFPGIKPGMHVLRLDTATLPAGVRAPDDRSYDSERSTRRLIHGVFDGGVIEDVNFAMQGGR